MSKFIFSISILFSILFTLVSSPAYADQSQHTITIQLDSASIHYDQSTQTYTINSVPDNAAGGYWTLELAYADHFNANQLQRLKTEYKHTQVKIVYIGDLQTDSDIEIVSCDIVSK